MRKIKIIIYKIIFNYNTHRDAALLLLINCIIILDKCRDGLSINISERDTLR